MPEEHRQFRPIRTPRGAQDWLSRNLRLVLQPVGSDGAPQGDQICIEPGGTFRPDPALLIGSRIEFRLQAGGDVSEFADLLLAYAATNEIPEALIGCAVFASTPFLRRSERIQPDPLAQSANWKIAEISRLEFPLSVADGPGMRPAVLKAPHHGCTIEFVVFLDAEAPRGRPLVPYRHGTWLCRSTFKFGGVLDGIGFRPIPLTDDLRRELGVGSETVRFARRNPFGVGLVESRTFDDYLEFYYDEKTLQAISAAPRTPQAVKIQTEIFLAAIEFVVMEVTRSGDLDGVGWDELGGSLIELLIRGIGDEASATELRRWLECLTSTPLEFIAKWEELVDYRSVVTKALVAE